MLQETPFTAIAGTTLTWDQKAAYISYRHHYEFFWFWELSCDIPPRCLSTQQQRPSIIYDTASYRWKMTGSELFNVQGNRQIQFKFKSDQVGHDNHWT